MGELRGVERIAAHQKIPDNSDISGFTATKNVAAMKMKLIMNKNDFSFQNFVSKWIFHYVTESAR